MSVGVAVYRETSDGVDRQVAGTADRQISNTVDRRIAIVVVASVVVLAATIRVGFAWAKGLLGSSFGFDESVYFLGAQHVVAGEFPYRDFVFVHPPGMLLALTPFAWLAELTTDSAAMAVAKVVFGLLGAACAGLVAWLLLRSAWSRRCSAAACTRCGRRRCGARRCS
ncbi:hypothetical protein [Gordonia sp. NB41Y]|uniref:hypothetical protein n=1 Tax=Gordonia sp. NB41Y TaxID=875808 RepID=UPI00128F0E31|nr:hypothetical protein [Gordonia sp. NB41Y]WLP92546.1 hypothetical protein Q9K23_10110 [Gordonia sp. NB41Y]